MTLSALFLPKLKYYFPFSLPTEPYKRGDVTTTVPVSKSTNGTACSPTTLIWSAKASSWTGFSFPPPVSACATTSDYRGGYFTYYLQPFVYFVNFHNWYNT